MFFSTIWLEPDQNAAHLLQRLPLSHCAKDIKKIGKIDLDQIENNLRMRKKCCDAEYNMFSASVKRALLIESLFLLCVSPVFFNRCSGWWNCCWRHCNLFDNRLWCCWLDHCVLRNIIDKEIIWIQQISSASKPEVKNFPLAYKSEKLTWQLLVICWSLIVNQIFAWHAKDLFAWFADNESIDLICFVFKDQEHFVPLFK